MTEKRTRDRFRGDLWLEQQADQRVKAALGKSRRNLHSCGSVLKDLTTKTFRKLRLK